MTVMSYLLLWTLLHFDSPLMNQLVLFDSQSKVEITTLPIQQSQQIHVDSKDLKIYKYFIFYLNCGMDTKLKLEFSLYRKSTLSSCKQVRKNPGLNGFQTHNGMIAQHLLL